MVVDSILKVLHFNSSGLSKRNVKLGKGNTFNLQFAWTSAFRSSSLLVERTVSSFSFFSDFFNSSTSRSRFIDCNVFFSKFFLRVSSMKINFFWSCWISSECFNKNRNTPPGVRRRWPFWYIQKISSISWRTKEIKFNIFAHTIIIMPPSFSIFWVSVNIFIGISRPKTSTIRTERRDRFAINEFIEIFSTRWDFSTKFSLLTRISFIKLFLSSLTKSHLTKNNGNALLKPQWNWRDFFDIFQWELQQ